MQCFAISVDDLNAVAAQFPGFARVLRYRAIRLAARRAFIQEANARLEARGDSSEHGSSKLDKLFKRAASVSVSDLELNFSAMTSGREATHPALRNKPSPPGPGRYSPDTIGVGTYTVRQSQAQSQAQSQMKGSMEVVKQARGGGGVIDHATIHKIAQEVARQLSHQISGEIARGFERMAAAQQHLESVPEGAKSWPRAVGGGVRFAERSRTPEARWLQNEEWRVVQADDGSYINQYGSNISQGNPPPPQTGRMAEMLRPAPDRPPPPSSPRHPENRSIAPRVGVEVPNDEDTAIASVGSPLWTHSSLYRRATFEARTPSAPTTPLYCQEGHSPQSGHFGGF